MTQKRAIIDIGSNTVRLVIYNGPPRAPVVLLNEKVAPRLGRHIAKTGLLSEKSMQVALTALRRYAALLELMAVKDVQTVATAAVREATNGPDFLKAIEALGLQPRLLSGKEEAKTSAIGVIAAFPGARGITGDLGGGSLELTRIDDDQCRNAITLPLGTLRLADMREGGNDHFAGQVRQMLRAANWSHGAGEPFFIVGGSWRALALYAMQLIDWPLDDPHDFELPAKDAAQICADLAQGKLAETVSRISSSRMESLPDAAALLSALIEILGPSRIVFSSWGLREGLLHSALKEDVRAQDPMTAGVSAFVKSYDISPDSASLVTDWIGDIAPGTDKVTPTLRFAATMLALAAMRTEPNVRAREALDWALRKRWIGLDSRGRALIAVAILANTGRTAVPEKLQRFASEEEQKWAVTWGLAVRLSRMLTNCNARALAHSSLGRAGNRLILTLDELTAPLYSDRVSENLRRLADRLGLEAKVEGIEPEEFA